MTTFPVTHRRLVANGLEFHVAEAGDPQAPLLILLHGFPEFWFAWRDCLAPLAALGFHVVAPDQRGYGLSAKPRRIEAYDLDTLADDVAGLASALGQREFDLVGHDWGASVAWWTAERHPSRVRRMVVLNAPHPAVWIRAMKTDPEQRRRSRYVQFLRLPWIPEAVLRRRAFRGLVGAFATARQDAFGPDVLEAYRDAWRQPGALTGMIHWYRALLRRSVPLPPPRTLAPPCLVLWGDLDPFAIPALADESATRCIDAEVVHLPDVGHWIVHDARDVVLAQLRRFLR